MQLASNLKSQASQFSEETIQLACSQYVTAIDAHDHIYLCALCHASTVYDMIADDCACPQDYVVVGTQSLSSIARQGIAVLASIMEIKA
jgi:hypothetical protein